jgi:peptidoglycan/xylan/chitin deacetylase (PgdA/CDA1 family)
VEEPIVLDPASPAVLLSQGPGAEPREQPRRAIDVPDRPVRAPAEEFARNPRAAGLVALTFDGCYDDGPVDAILTALQAEGCRATFFIAGRFAERYPGAVRRLAEAGMEIGNHSWGHPQFTRLTDAGIRDELTRTGTLLEHLTGRKPTLFRPPFGARDRRVREVVASEGYRTVYWALDSWDAVQHDITPAGVRDRVLSRVRPGDVVLMHIGSKATAEALPQILAGLRRMGLRVVTVGELMEPS